MNDDSTEAINRLAAAIGPISDYLERTPRPNRHADHVAELVDAACDVGKLAEEKANDVDWEAIAMRIGAHCTPSPPSERLKRIRAHLDQPHMQARAALPLAERMMLAQVTSHHLGLPDYLRDRDQPI